MIPNLLGLAQRSVSRKDFSQQGRILLGLLQTLPDLARTCNYTSYSGCTRLCNSHRLPSQWQPSPPAKRSHGQGLEALSTLTAETKLVLDEAPEALLPDYAFTSS